MKRLYAPWRNAYVTKAAGSSKSDKFTTANDCVFCSQLAQQDDEKYFILKRYKHCFVMMNFYPYNAGHLLILPYEHKANLYDLSQETRAELMETVNTALSISEKTLYNDGFNVGINLGGAGGGGIPSHLHIHTVPRWQGDTAFLEVLGATKLISNDLQKIYLNLKKAFDHI
jgi:ATP adenylyltransferase